MKFARRVFAASGIYGLLVLLPQYVLEQRIGADSPPPITHPAYFYGFIGVAVAWQVVFLIIGTDPARYRALMLPAILEKLLFAVPTAILFAQGRATSQLLAGALIDALWGVLFAIAWVNTPSASGSARLPIRPLQQPGEALADHGDSARSV